MPSDETQFLHELETEVEAELDEARSSHPEKELGASPTEWLFDPTDVQREEVGLRSLLAGIEALERDIASRGAFYPSRDADRRKDIRSSTANGAPMAHSIGDSLRPLRELPHQTEQIDSLDHVAEHVAKAVKRAVPDGSPGNEVLSGADLGHPLHPPLTDVVIGAWTSALALDWLGGKRSGPAADRLVALGVLSAIPTAAAGLNDWATLRGPSRRLGLVHETTNVIATGLFGASWLARKVGHRLFGRLLALVGYGTVSLGAFLGRHLSFRRGVGVDHTALLEAPRIGRRSPTKPASRSWSRCWPKRAGVEIVLVREGGSLYGLLERCAHLGGPLHEGGVEDGCVVCPWHSSRYRLSDGAAMSGPPPTHSPRLR